MPKQYLQAAGRPLIAHALDALLAHPRVDGAVVALAAGDPRWPGWTSLHGKPVLACVGGGERADSVLAALRERLGDPAQEHDHASHIAVLYERHAEQRAYRAVDGPEES